MGEKNEDIDNDAIFNGVGGGIYDFWWVWVQYHNRAGWAGGFTTTNHDNHNYYNHHHYNNTTLSDIW